jgi:hypothetical protein
MDGTGGREMKRNESRTEKQTPHVLTYIWKLKKIGLMKVE